MPKQRMKIREVQVLINQLVMRKLSPLVISTFNTMILAAVEKKQDWIEVYPEAIGNIKSILGIK